MLIRLLALLTTVIPLVSADVKFLTPAAGASLPSGSLAVAWQESGTPPLITSLGGWTLSLMVGGNNDGVSESIASVAGSSTGAKSATLTFGPAVGPLAANGYYLKMISTSGTGTGTVINYSNRFSVTGMTGSWSSTAAQADFKTISGTAGPATQNTISGNGAAAPGVPPAAQGGSYTVSYQFQTGLTKYAPMQPKPGSTITAKNTAPLYPASPYTVATTFLPVPVQVTTFTQSATYSASSMENTAAPAPQPSNDMQKFLARWID